LLKIIASASVLSGSEIHLATTQLYQLGLIQKERVQARGINSVNIDRVHFCKK